MKSTYNVNNQRFGMVRSVTDSGLLVSLFTSGAELIGEVIDKDLRKELTAEEMFEFYFRGNRINIQNKNYKFLPISERR